MTATTGEMAIAQAMLLGAQFDKVHSPIAGKKRMWVCYGPATEPLWLGPRFDSRAEAAMAYLSRCGYFMTIDGELVRI